MREALDAVHSGMSVSKVSELYGIPRTILNDHKLGKVKPGVKPGAPSLLSPTASLPGTEGATRVSKRGASSQRNPRGGMLIIACSYTG